MPPRLKPQGGSTATSGILIAVEGIDGSGLSTQARALARWLGHSGRPALLTKEPSSGPAGRLIRRSLRGHGAAAALSEPAMAALFAADRLDHLSRTVEPALAQGMVVISDRYLLSSFAYQSLAVDLDWLRHLNRRARRPDLTLLLEVPTAVSRSRRQARPGDERYEADDHLELVRERFVALGLLLRAELGVVAVDAQGPPDEVLARLKAAVVERLP